jgi:UDP-N-acetylmuramyl tripeptide synthase
MKLQNILIIFVSKFIIFFLKSFSLGSGSTWPGHIALKLNKHFIKDAFKSSKTKVILLAGTNGKTTTSTLLQFILTKNGNTVFQNGEGANLLNGIASTIIKHSTWMGKIEYDFAIFEIDENILPLILKEITPHSIILLNLFRDQLDRYGEVNTIAARWHASLKDIPDSVHVYLNGDDPQIYFLGSDIRAKVHYFGLPDEIMTKKDVPHDVDSIYCPRCGEKLNYTLMSYSHLGDFSCEKCGFKRENITTYEKKYLESPLKGVYNYYNISALYLFAKNTLQINEKLLHNFVVLFKPAFGRQEIIPYKGRNIFLLLSKNPTGFNQSIEAIKELTGKKKSNLVLLLNDRIPDGRDISWIWDVEFQEVLPISDKIYISGDRAFDMALRLKYSLEENSNVLDNSEDIEFDSILVINSTNRALEKAINETPTGETLYILATYSAMLDVRHILIGKKLL